MQFSKSFYCSSSRGSAVRQAWGRFRRQSCIKSFKVKWTSVAKASTITPAAAIESASSRQRWVKRTSYNRWAWQARQHCAGRAEGRKNEWISCPVRQQRRTLTFDVAPEARILANVENVEWGGEKLQASLTHRPLIVLTQIDWDTGKTIWGFLDGGGKGKGEREEISRSLDFPSRMTQHDISIHCRMLSTISELDFDVISSFGFIDLYCKVWDCNHN